MGDDVWFRWRRKEATLRFECKLVNINCISFSNFALCIATITCLPHALASRSANHFGNAGIWDPHRNGPQNFILEARDNHSQQLVQSCVRTEIQVGSDGKFERQFLQPSTIRATRIMADFDDSYPARWCGLRSTYSDHEAVSSQLA